MNRTKIEIDGCLKEKYRLFLEYSFIKKVCTYDPGLLSYFPNS